MSKLVCLDAGHGGVDPGAMGNGLREKDITLKMALKVGDLLKKQGVDVVYTRITDATVALNERCRIANSRDCDCFVSIHTNSAVNSSAKGIETLCYTKNNLAYYIQQNLIDALKLSNRGVKERKELAVLNGTEMEAVLVELGFISNADEANLLKTESFLNTSAEYIAKGVCKYLGVDYKEGEIKVQADKVNRIYKYGNITKSFEVLNCNGKNYVAIRDFAELLGKKVDYDNVTKITKILD